MIALFKSINVKVTGSEKLNPDAIYPVIGTYTRMYQKQGEEKEKEQDFFMVVRPDGIIVNIFPSKCKVMSSEPK